MKFRFMTFSLADACIIPYVERLDTGSITIHWETELPEPSIVAFSQALPVTDRAIDETLTRSGRLMAILRIRPALSHGSVGCPRR